MATFQAPVSATGVPPVLPDGDPDQHPLGARLFRYYSARPGGDGNNVYYKTDGTVTDVDPFTTYNSDGSVDVDAWSDVAHVWWAGHAAETVTAAQATALTAAGYTVVP